MLFLNRITGRIIKEIENSISDYTFLQNFRMKPLPDLCKKFIELVEILVSQFLSKYQVKGWHLWKLSEFFILQKDSDPSNKDIVVLLLQDMLELVTRDMMVNEIRFVDAAVFITIETIFTIL